MRRQTILIALFVGVLSIARAQTSKVSYWYDEDIANRQETAVLNGSFTIDGADRLGVGLHTIYFAVIGTHPSSVISYLFYVNPQPATENYTLRFWTDDEVETPRDYVILDNGLKEIAIDDLASGDHDLRAMLVDSEGRPMSVESGLFTYQGDATDGVNAGAKVDVSDGMADPIYNLQGQRVQTAKKGLYIMGGKKVVVE